MVIIETKIIFESPSKQSLNSINENRSNKLLKETPFKQKNTKSNSGFRQTAKNFKSNSFVHYKSLDKMKNENLIRAKIPNQQKSILKNSSVSRSTETLNKLCEPSDLKLRSSSSIQFSNFRSKSNENFSKCNKTNENKNIMDTIKSPESFKNKKTNSDFNLEKNINQINEKTAMEIFQLFLNKLKIENGTINEKYLNCVKQFSSIILPDKSIEKKLDLITNEINILKKQINLNKTKPINEIFKGDNKTNVKEIFSKSPKALKKNLPPNNRQTSEHPKLRDKSPHSNQFLVKNDSNIKSIANNINEYNQTSKYCGNAKEPNRKYNLRNLTVKSAENDETKEDLVVEKLKIELKESNEKCKMLEYLLEQKKKETGHYSKLFK